MPSQKNKSRKVKSEAPEAATTDVRIKTEPLDIKFLSAYVDDRVELIRQAFTCLKPKEFKSLVPDFLQGKSIESIQERCLDELLGISTKRLLSIINNTKCPTDTESSSDEDEKIVEHISLDEISSDSEVELAKPTRKIKSKKAKASDVKSNAKPIKNGDKKSEKEMTVLELLELQARARAIRSQLALEPITKIELDSDQDADNPSDSDREPLPGASKTNENSKSSDTNIDRQSASSPPKEQPKRVRLKRNFRIRQVGEDDPPEEATQSSTTEQSPTRKSRSKSKEKIEESPKSSNDISQFNAKEAVQNSKSRESSPEVIPVIPSPETLCISSDSEEEKALKAKTSIFVENIEELDKQLMEKQVRIPTPKPDNKYEPEEGELTEEDKSPNRSRNESVQSNSSIIEPTALEETNGKEHPVKNSEQDEELDYEVREITDSEPETSAHQNDSNKTDEEKAGSIESDSDSESDGDKSSSDNDDNDEEHDPDVVEIHDSSDETLLEQKMAEDEAEKSWGSRWLQSKRVAKVMAASRLGNKVRDKLKEKKKQKQQEQQEEARKIASPEPPPAPKVPSNVEEGSVEHYKELVARAGDNVSTDKVEVVAPTQIPVVDDTV